MASSPAETNAELLRGVLAELKQLNELMENFTGDGFPLNRSVPNTETISAIAMAVALVMRHDPRISQADLDQRLAAAPVLATQLIQALDAFQRSTQVQQLESLRQR
jgi:hypothetical protein